MENKNTYINVLELVINDTEEKQTIQHLYLNTILSVVIGAMNKNHLQELAEVCGKFAYSKIHPEKTN